MTAVSWASLALPDEHLTACVAVLSDDERARADRLRAPDARRRFIAARAFLRRELGAALGCAPDEVRLHIDPHGKPGLADTAVQFNISHSEDLAVLAIDAGQAVGIDIESRREVHDGVARKILSADEYRAWSDGAPETRNERLLRAWTRKEAALKALGSGFRTDPRLLHVGDGTDAVTLCIEDRHIVVRHLDCPNGFLGALATVEP